MSVRFPSAEVVVINFLKAQLELGVKVGSRTPATGSKFVKVVRVGGARNSRVTDAATLAIEAYAPSDDEAEALMADIRELLPLMHLADHDGVHVYRAVESGGLVNLPDPDHSSHRYSINFTVTVRGQKTARVLK